MATRLVICLLLSLLAATPHLTRAAGDVQNWGEKFVRPPPVKFGIHRRTLDRLPSRLDCYVTDRTPFSSAVVEWLIDTTVANTGERKMLKQKLAENPSLLTSGKTVLKRDEDSQLVVNPAAGVMLFAVQPQALVRFHDEPVPAGQTNMLALETFHRTLREIIAKLGWSEAEFEKKANGEFRVLVSDDCKFPNHQKEPVLYARSVRYNRCAKGMPMASGTSAFEIVLERYASGAWKRIFIHWPNLKRIGNVEVPRSVAALQQAVEAGETLWDYNNEFSPKEVSRITVTDVRLVYSTSRDGTSSPVLCLDTKAQTKDGSNYAVLFLPLVKRISEAR